MALTPEDLIASLQQHLSDHARLLPALHSQLGLPPSALTRELEQLQATLNDVVEAQLKERRGEVDQWMARCDEEERHCLELVKCLGAHAKSLQSVGELRKVQVLPKRHEQLLSHKEKLLKIYQTKTEQISSLSNRISALSRTLGTAFFASDVLPHSTLEPADALLDLGSTSATPTPPTRLDVTPERFKRLETEIQRGKSEISSRLSHLSATLELIVWFYAELGMTLPTPEVTSTPMLGAGAGGSIPRSSSTTAQSGIPGLSSGRVGHDPSSYDQILARYVARWEEAEDEGLESDTLGVEGVDPTNGVMQWAESLKVELEQRKAHRESEIQTIFDQLETLWKRLGVPEEDIDSFVEANRGSRDENVAAYEAELERMLDMKRERMSVFICNAREEIVELWNDLILGEDERAEFVAFLDDEHNEELLARHEEEISRLKEERRIKAPILASITKYFEICDDERKLAESAADQSRLMGRGPRDPGRLLREEKMRKRVKKEKPKLEQELLQIIPVWETERGRPFLINGIRVVDVLMESLGAEAEKENAKKKPAPKSVPARATTPGPSNTAPPPGSRKHAATPSSHQGPAKRPRLAPSTAGPTPVVRPSSATPGVGMSRQPPPPVPVFGGSSNANRPGSAMSSHSGKGGPTTTGGKGKMHGAATLGLGLPSGGFNRTASATTTVSVSGTAASRTASGTYHGQGGAARMAATRKRESFRPRKSVDSAVFGMGGMMNYGKAVGGAGGVRLVEDMVKEEDDDF